MIGTLRSLASVLAIALALLPGAAEFAPAWARTIRANPAKSLPRAHFPAATSLSLPRFQTVQSGLSIPRSNPAYEGFHRRQSLSLDASRPEPSAPARLSEALTPLRSALSAPAARKPGPRIRAHLESFWENRGNSDAPLVRVSRTEALALNRIGPIHTAVPLGTGTGTEPAPPEKERDQEDSPEPPKNKGFFGKMRQFMGELVNGDPQLEPFLKPYRSKVIWSSVLLTLAGIGGVAGTRIMGYLYDAAIAQDPTLLGIFAGSIFALSLVSALVQMFHDRMIQKTRINLTRDLRSHLFSHLLAQPSRAFQKEKPAELAGRLISDVAHLPTKNITSRVAFPYYLVMFLISATAMLLTSWKLAAASAVMTPILIWMSIRYGYKREKIETRIASGRAEIVRSAEGGLTLEREIKVAHANEPQSATFRSKVEHYRDVLVENVRLTTGYNFMFGQMSMASSHFLVIFLGLFAHVFLGEPSVGSVIAMAGFAAYMRLSFQGLVGLYTNNRAAEGASKRVLELLSRDRRIANKPDAVKLEALSEAIRLSDVSASGDTGERLLDAASMSFKKGKRTAVVHADGSELGPLADLILRLQDPETGRLTYDGTPYRDALVGSVRHRVGLLDRDSSLLPGTIRENMQYLSPGTEDAAIKDALKKARAEFLLNENRFPDGLETQFEKIESRLTEREKRLLLLARLFLQDPDVIILNGSEGGLEGIDRRIFESMLERLLEERTVISLWPKVSELQRMDDILVLHEGKVAESGTHDALLEKGSLYKRLLDAISKI